MFFDEKQEEANGYNPETNFKPELCKPGTRGTINEDESRYEVSLAPRNHFWLPNTLNHEPWWGWMARDAASYARDVFSEAVVLYGRGEEEKGFEYFGRAIHLLEDMSSVPHVFGDSHPAYFPLSVYLDNNGYERWVAKYSESTSPPNGIVQVDSLVDSMQQLATETFRSSRIQGRLWRSSELPVTEDLADMFSEGDIQYITFVSKDETLGLFECWYLPGAGPNYFGDDAEEPDSLLALPPLLFLENAWTRVDNLPGEAGEFYYIERNSDQVVPRQVWQTSAGSGQWVPNGENFSLAQLWAGVPGYRATPKQEQELVPRAIEYTAGFMKYLWDFVNPPPHLVGVHITQPDPDDSAVQLTVYDKRWQEDFFMDRPTPWRKLQGTETMAAKGQATIRIAFSEPVEHVGVSLKAGSARKTILLGGTSKRGPPVPWDQDGEDFIEIPAIDLSDLPAGLVTLHVEADDLSNHIGEDCSHIDPDPSTRAARKPDGSWERYRGEGGDMPEVDRNHTFTIGSYEVRVSPPTASVVRISTVAHSVEVRNRTAPPGSEASFAIGGSGPFWTTNAAEFVGFQYTLPAPEEGWVDVGKQLNVRNGGASAGSILYLQVAVSVEGEEEIALVSDVSVDPPGDDHPDDTASVADPRYPTPWLIDPEAPVGILAGGWGAGLGHLLGRYGIATSAVDAASLSVLGRPGAGLRDTRALLIGSGGLTGLENVASFRAGLEEYVAGGGVLVAFTPKRGAELAALPGGKVSGYGWIEDQACFGAAVSIVERHPTLAGQTMPRLDVGADGYLTLWPDDAQVLLRRTASGQPAMIRYPYGRGEVFVLTLYPDWAYGGGQSSPAERSLVRDLVTYALAFPAPIAEYLAGGSVSLTPVIANHSSRDTALARIETFSPDRKRIASEDVPLPLGPWGFSELPRSLSAPADPGIYVVTAALLGAEGEEPGPRKDVAFFAVRAPLELPGDAESGFRIWVTTTSDTVPSHAMGSGVVHVRNDTAEEFQGYLAATWIHYGDGPMVTLPDVVVPAFGEASFVLEYPIDYGSMQVVYGLYRGTPPAPADFPEGSLAAAIRGFKAVSALVAADVLTDRDRVLPGETLTFGVRLTERRGLSIPLEVTIRLRGMDNLEWWSEQLSVTLDAGAVREEAFSFQVPADARNGCFLDVEVRYRASIVGQAAKSFRIPTPRLSILPGWPRPWPIGEQSHVQFTFSNVGELPTEAGSCAVRLLGPAEETLWSAAMPFPVLAPGERETGTVVATLASTRFGAHALEWEALVGGERIFVRRPLSNELDADIAVVERPAAAGEPLHGTVTIANRGDFVGPLRLSLAAPDLGLAQEWEIAGTEAIGVPFSMNVPQEALPGVHQLVATLRMGDDRSFQAPIFIPPGDLEFLPVAEEARAGETIELDAVNVGGASLALAWRLRLLPCSADLSATAVGENAGTTAIARGGDAAFTVAVPEALPRGLYTLAFSARDDRAGREHTRLWHIFVDGPTAALEVATDRPVYAPNEDIAAFTRIVNGPLSIVGATLSLEVTGAAGIAPISFDGTVHVAPSGDDLTGDGSAELPYATVQAGIDRAPAGARVLLAAGTYAGSFSLRQGTILQGEIVGGAPAAVITDADIAGASGVTLDHLRLHNAHVVFTDPVTDVRVTDCILEDGNRSHWAGQGLVFVKTAERVLIARNRFLRFGLTEGGIVFYNPASGIAVLENEFADMPVGRGHGVHFWYGGEDVLIQGNRFARLAGKACGIHLWDDSRNVRILKNRLEVPAEGSEGIHLWDVAEGVVIRGNEIIGPAVDCSGIHLWSMARDVLVADNTLRGLRGEFGGIHLWGYWSEPSLGLAVENNRLEDLGLEDPTSTYSGIHVWSVTRHATVRNNVLRSVTDALPEALLSGIGLWASVEGVDVSRNVVQGGAAGVILGSGPLSGAVAHNLILSPIVGIVEREGVAADALALRDNIVVGAGRAGILYESLNGLEATSLVLQNDLYNNAVAFEGRPDLSGVNGNIVVDPLLADVAAGDFRLLPGSPCLDTASDPPFDIGPLDDDADIALGPRPVVPEQTTTVLWRSDIPLDLAPNEVGERATPVGPPEGFGQFLLQARLSGAGGLAIAEQTASFVRHDGSLSVSLAAPRDAYRPGETIPLDLEVVNHGLASLSGLVVRLCSGLETIHEETVDLAPGGSASRLVETTSWSSAVFNATAGLASADLAIRIAGPEVTLELQAPTDAGDDSFMISALLRNSGAVPADLTLDLDGEAHELSLGVGEAASFTKSCRISGDTLFVATLDGDARDVVTALVRYGPRPWVEIRPAPLYAAGAVVVAMTTGNSGSVGALVTVEADLLTQEGASAGAWTLSAWLEPGASAEESLALGALAAGEYRLRARIGTTMEEAAFTVLAPTDAVISSVVVPEEAAGPEILPVTVSVANRGAEALAGTLTLETVTGLQSRDILLGAREERAVVFELTTTLLAAGEYPLRTVLAQYGDVLAIREGTLSLHARPFFSSVPEPPLLETGYDAAIAIGIGNRGLVGGAVAVRLVCGDFLDATEVAMISPAGEATVSFSFAVPVDLPAGAISGFLRLTNLESGAVEERTVTFQIENWLDVGLRGTLDRPAYRDGDEALLALTISAYPSHPENARILVSHGDYREWQEILLMPRPWVMIDALRVPGELHLFPGRGNGEFHSSVLDVGDTSGARLSWVADIPSECTLAAEVGTGNTPEVDETWPPFQAVENGAVASDRLDRFLRYVLRIVCPSPGYDPSIAEAVVDLPATGGRVVHTSIEDFTLMPLHATFSFPVDFSAGDRVFYGLYNASDRALALDVATIRHAEGQLALTTDRDRYRAGDAVQVVAETSAAGLLGLEGPGWQETAMIDAPGSYEFSFLLPAEMTSGTYFVSAHLAEAAIRVPIEVVGYSALILAADLDRAWYLPGEAATLSLTLFSSDDLPGVTIEGALSNGSTTVPAFSSVRDLAWGSNLIVVVFPVSVAAPGTSRCDFSISLPGQEGSPLYLASGSVLFDLLAPNLPPVADAGADIAAEERSWVTLDGSASFDPDGDQLNWDWRQTAGPGVALCGGDGPYPQFLAPDIAREGGTLAFALTVSDGRAESAEDAVIVSLADRNRAPVAHAGSDGTRAVGEPAQLDGSLSYDPDGDALTFAWEMSTRPEGSDALFEDPDAIQPIFLVDHAGEYEIALTVSDGIDASGPDLVRVSTVNSAPTAEAGSDRTASQGETVVLDGAASADPDEDPLVFHWRLIEQPAGSAAVLDDAGTPAPSFSVDLCGDYLVELTVDDGQLASDPDTVRIDCTNARPVADAGPDLAGRIGQRALLDGGASADPDGDPLAWHWALSHSPAGSRAVLSGLDSPVASLVPDLIGSYGLILVVADGELASLPDGVVVEAGTNVAAASVAIKPAAIRRSVPPVALQVWIELPKTWSAREIDPAKVAITAVGKRTLARQVRRIAGKGARIVDRDHDGRPELSLWFPVKPLLKYLVLGKNRLTLKGPLRTTGRFLGSATLTVSR